MLPGLEGCSLDWEGSPWIRSSRATQTEQKQIMAATIWNGEQPERGRESSEREPANGTRRAGGKYKEGGGKEGAKRNRAKGEREGEAEVKRTREEEGEREGRKHRKGRGGKGATEARRGRRRRLTKDSENGKRGREGEERRGLGRTKKEEEREEERERGSEKEERAGRKNGKRRTEEEDRRGGQKRRTEEAWTYCEKGREVESNEDHEQATFQCDHMFVGLYCFRNIEIINQCFAVPWYKLAKKQQKQEGKIGPWNLKLFFFAGAVWLSARAEELDQAAMFWGGVPNFSI